MLTFISSDTIPISSQDEGDLIIVSETSMPPVKKAKLRSTSVESNNHRASKSKPQDAFSQLMKQSRKASKKSKSSKK